MRPPGGVPTERVRGVVTGPITPSDTGPPLTVPRDPAREAARRELTKGVYHEHEPSWARRAWDSLVEWLADLLGQASTATPGGGVGLAVVIAAALAVLAALWWRFGTPRRSSSTTPGLHEDRPHGAADHRALAESHAAAGRWNEALQERVRALVRSLEERALIDLRPGRTADEAATEAARSLPGHADGLRAAARDFDDVTYGGRAASEPAYRRVADLDRTVERTPAVPPRAADRADRADRSEGVG
ncbi:DUF4129 domain-containing protein [Streptomyces sp. WMMC905]|uniref:DUF4129 domain-containing protein n=1 Tax=Streptomyces sp. WMMC905 TaxID=3404123 RepID=UPI003B947D1A